MEETKKKGFNTSSNSYTILYSVVIVVIVAFLLAFVSSSLKPQQDENVALDKKKQILAALNIRDIDGAEATNIYNKVVTADKIIDRNGEEVEKGEQGGTKAGFLCNSASMKEGKLALYVCNVEGETKYVIPVYFGAASTATSRSTPTSRPFTAPTSTTKARQQVLAQKSRTRALGRTSSRASTSSLKARTAWLSL